MSSKFIDEAKIYVRSGHGGPGVVSFRREKFIPRGGPDGGDGGAGGSVIFEVNPQMSTLLDFKFRRRFNADDGDPGDRQNMSGHRGADTVISVPEGTVIKSADGNILHDMSGENKRIVFFSGGRGGKGNWFFKNSVNQAPKFCQPGESGKEAELILVLKLLADVGIIGFPNAGKSTLISRISAARPKIADYPFTTLVPNLGVVQFKDFESFVVADIPGLIKGAHKGAGLGTRFLRHIERTKFFVHIVDGSEFSGRDPLQDYLDLNEEIRLYDQEKRLEEGFIELSSRPQIAVINKADVLSEQEREDLQEKFATEDIHPLFISAVSGLGLKTLIEKMTRLLSEEKENCAKEKEVFQREVSQREVSRKVTQSENFQDNDSPHSPL